MSSEWGSIVNKGGIVVGPGETRVIRGQAISVQGSPEVDATVDADVAAALEAARDAGAKAYTGITNLGGSIHISNSTVSGPDGTVRHIDDLTLGPRQAVFDEPQAE